MVGESTDHLIQKLDFVVRCARLPVVPVLISGAFFKVSMLWVCLGTKKATYEHQIKR